MPRPFDLVPLLLDGARVTVLLTVLSTALTLVLAVLVGVARARARNRVLRFFLLAYVEIFRGTSALIQLFWAFFVLPLFGLTLPAFGTGVVVLGLNQGAYGSEVVRGAIQAIPKTQWEAATSLNMSPRQAMWRVIFPQAWAAMLPPMTNIVIDVLKGTSLVSLIFLSELTFAAQSIRLTTLRSAEVFTLILLMYLAMSKVIAVLFHRLELRRAWV